MLAAPPTSYARSGEARIAFQVIGDGPPDVVVVGGPASHLDLQRKDPETARVRRRYGSFARAIFFDRRGTGLSDPVDRLPSLDLQMDDLDAVLDAVGVERVALIGAVTLNDERRAQRPGSATARGAACWIATTAVHLCRKPAGHDHSAEMKLHAKRDPLCVHFFLNDKRPPERASLASRCLA